MVFRRWRVDPRHDRPRTGYGPGQVSRPRLVQTTGAATELGICRCARMKPPDLRRVIGRFCR